MSNKILSPSNSSNKVYTYPRRRQKKVNISAFIKYGIIILIVILVIIQIKDRYLSDFEMFVPEDRYALELLIQNQDIPLNLIDIRNIDNLSRLFYLYPRDNYSGIETWNVSHVKDMSEMFKNTTEFKGGISNWNVSNVENMMFMFAYSNFSDNLSSWNVSEKANYYRMFDYSPMMNNLPEWYKGENRFKVIYTPETKDELITLISGRGVYPGEIDISNITDLSYVFANKSYFELMMFTSFGVEDVYRVYGRKEQIDEDEIDTYEILMKDIMHELPGIEFWEVSHVDNMSHMFDTSLLTADLSSWNVSNVKDMSFMFHKAPYFNGDIGNWNVSNVDNMSHMFFKAHNFRADISSWNVSNVRDMSYMFANAPYFNAPIGKWNVQNVKNMAGMFFNIKNFNQDLSSWNVSNVDNMSHMFLNNKKFNSPIGYWNVSNVKNMARMFYMAESFNQPLDRWNVYNVENMDLMFSYAKNFNQNIDKWNVYENTSLLEVFAQSGLNTMPVWYYTIKYHSMDKDN